MANGASRTSLSPNQILVDTRNAWDDPVSAGQQEVSSEQPNLNLFRFGDASDAYANQKQLYISFYHLPSQRQVNFKAFITNMNQNFTVDWNYEQVFGRNDPIATFKNTTRRMNISFEIPAASADEAELNLLKCNALSQFMYPAYEKGNRANTIAKPPLLRVAFSNLIRNSSKGPQSAPGAVESGLLVTVSTLNITPSFGDEGFFDSGYASSHPKLITIDMDFTVLHEHDLGWDSGAPYGEGGAENPFGFNKEENATFPFGVEGFVLPSARPPTRSADQIQLEQNQADIDEILAANPDFNQMEVTSYVAERNYVAAGGRTAAEQRIDLDVLTNIPSAGPYAGS